MDSEPPQTGAPISLNAPQRPLRIGRGDKYYEVLFVGGVAQERRLGRRTNQDETRNSLILDNQRQEQREEYPVLDAQDSPVSELNPQPSVRRRRSRQGLAVQPTPPLRRHRPGSIRSKESTPSLDSSETSFSEEVVRETSAQPSLYALPEQDSEVYSDNNAGPTATTPRIPTKTLVPIYDKPRHIYLTPEQEPLGPTMSPERSLPSDSGDSAQQRPGEDCHLKEEQRLENVPKPQGAESDSQRQQREGLQRHQQPEPSEKQREQLAMQHRAAVQKLQQEELLKQQRLDSERQQQMEVQRQQQLEVQRQQQLEVQRQQQLELLKEQETEMLRQQQAELQRQQQTELQRQVQIELQRQQQAELQKQQQAELERQQQAELERQRQAELQRQRQAELRRQQEEELQRQQQQQELQRLKEVETQRQQQIELQRQQQAELQRQQQAELQRQQEWEMLRQQQAAIQKKQQEQNEAELRARQAAESQSRQQAELQEYQRAETNPAQTHEESLQRPEAVLSRKPSQRSSQPRVEPLEMSSLSAPATRSSHPDRVDVSLSRRQTITVENSPRREKSRSPHSVRNVTPASEKTTPRITSSRPEQASDTFDYRRRTAPAEGDRGEDSEIRAALGNDAAGVEGNSAMQIKAVTPMRAPVAHRETPNEPTLGTSSPESLVDWYENDENFLVGGDDDDQSEGSIKRKPSKIIRKIKGLFENKKPDETPSSTSTERKRSDQLEPPPSPREPTTPTKKSKLGQFFSFNKKDERRRASPPPPLVYAPACQGPEDIPDGMLTKVFRSKLIRDKGAQQPTTPKTAPPFPNFREWSPSTEDLSKVGKGNEKEFTKPSKYFVPKIPPFQPRLQTPQTVRAEFSTSAPERQLGDDLSVPETSEARNSPYSLCRNRGSVKSSNPRRTSLAEDDVDEMYEQFFEKEHGALLPNPQKATEETPSHTFVRKPSKKAAAIPPELRAPIYQPLKNEAPTKPYVDDSESRRTQTSPPPPQQEQVSQEPPVTEYIEIEEILIEEEIIEETISPPDTRNSIQQLRPLFKQAWMLIDFMTQDLIDGVPKEAWGELRILFLIMIGMLVLLYVQGILHFTGDNPLSSLRTLFRGFQVLLVSAIQAGMAIHDAVDAMLTDASSKLVADTLKEI